MSQRGWFNGSFGFVSFTLDQQGGAMLFSCFLNLSLVLFWWVRSARNTLEFRTALEAGGGEGLKIIKPAVQKTALL